MQILIGPKIEAAILVGSGSKSFKRLQPRCRLGLQLSDSLDWGQRICLQDGTLLATSRDLSSLLLRRLHRVSCGSHNKATVFPMGYIMEERGMQSNKVSYNLVLKSQTSISIISLRLHTGHPWCVQILERHWILVLYSS